MLSIVLAVLVPLALAAQARAQVFVQTGPTQEQIQNGVVKIGFAVAAHLVADKAAKDDPSNLGKQIAVGLLKGARDAAVESGLRDLFPRLTPRQAGDIRRLACGILDGRFLGNNAQEAKTRLMADLRAVDPNLADVVLIADFLYSVSQLRGR
jgi:hypothetical protein